MKLLKTITREIDVDGWWLEVERKMMFFDQQLSVEKLKLIR